MLDNGPQGARADIAGRPLDHTVTLGHGWFLALIFFCLSPTA
jgi:hypothetical protein